MKIDKAYRYIKRQIIESKWEPEAAINVNELSETLNISKTPIHKALSKLELEGFVSIIPQVGVYVKRPDPNEIIERLLVCANLDALMTEQAAPHLTVEDFHYMERILKKMDNPKLSPEDYASLNIDFHKTIYEASKLTYTFNLANQLWDYLNFVGNPEDLFNDQRRKQSQTEHWSIFYSLIEKDSRMANRLMEKHMRRVSQLVGEKYQDIKINERVFN
ncbi:GntR family transcriptional regulator [Neobacillus bataviensis LMG 21833]|uniref:GntR family transcriptional regulator n=1 Tax=Neobacillus bataviensis LMG 21833 TaxID=1117379 RepID=K6DAK2_9BACI|nr:GntR family transcriptional regulator [Neobacillus bataviensis]EKN65349.1 GntR family transcriptional regulator [Neobacillus bataviensis LMG 21833]